MRNFSRCLRACWPYRHRLLLSVACAMLAALFWSVNFLGIHPVLKILGGNKSLPESVQADVDQAQREIGPTREKLERLRVEWDQRAGDEERRRELADQISQAEW